MTTAAAAATAATSWHQLLHREKEGGLEDPAGCFSQKGGNLEKEVLKIPVASFLFEHNSWNVHVSLPSEAGKASWGSQSAEGNTSQSWQFMRGDHVSGNGTQVRSANSETVEWDGVSPLVGSRKRKAMREMRREG